MASAHPPIPEQFRKSKEELDEYQERVVRYLASMNMFREMYRKGILDKADFAVCDKVMAEKYGLSDNSIYRYSDPDNPQHI